MAKKARHPANPDAPRFEPDAWRFRGDENTDVTGRELALLANCYQYSVAGSKPDGSNTTYHENIPNPGETSGIMYHRLHQKDVLKKAAVADGLIIAKAQASTDGKHASLPPARSGYYLVGMYTENIPPNKDNPEGVTDFHFIRQDADGGWSHKQGKGMNILVERYMEPNSRGEYQPLPLRFGKNKTYHFTSYAYVPKSGIDAGIEQPLIRAILMNRAYARKQEDSCQSANVVFDNTLPNQSNEVFALALEDLQNLGYAMKKHGISEAVETYQWCLDAYVKKLRKPLKPSELQIDAR